MGIFQRLCQSRELRRQLELSRNRLYRTAYSWCHDTHLADDLVQQTLLKALQNTHQLRELSGLDAWQFRILSNCWYDHCRRRRDVQDIDETPYWHDQTPEAEHGRDEKVKRVRDAIGALPMPQRQVITLVDLAGLSYSEVAEVLEIPVGTVMSRVCRARRTLKEYLIDLKPTQDEVRSQIRRIK